MVNDSMDTSKENKRINSKENITMESTGNMNKRKMKIRWEGKMWMNMEELAKQNSGKKMENREE